ncbi:MAG: ATP synthase F1 subunit gamma [Fibrobacter sp.]|nr:ATP synthase F1 subunit gamma [Fibrobacter sp.]
MQSISELRKQIRGIASTQKITNAMKMVAGARFNKALSLMHNTQTFHNELKVTFDAISSVLEPPSSKRKLISVSDTIPEDRIGIIVMTGDKGLCGDFNTSILKEANRFFVDKGNSVKAGFGVGRKASNFIRSTGLTVKSEYPLVTTGIEFAFADKIGREILSAFATEDLSSIVCVSSRFHSMGKRSVTATPLLPLIAKKKETTTDLLIEPLDSDEVFAAMIPLLFKAQIFSLLQENYVSELSARIRAMDNATTNAGVIIDQITLEMNKARQASITREIAEIIGTNEVIK